MVPAPNHYRCIICYLPSTRTEIISDTLVFIRHTIPIPFITTHIFLTQVVSDIITLLTCPSSNIPTPLQIGDSVKLYNQKKTEIKS